jgi:hypothetical protein
MLGAGAFTEFHYQDESHFLQAMLVGLLLVLQGLNRYTQLFAQFPAFSFITVFSS